jgi:hypothetical protein
MNTRERDKLTAAHRALEARNMADAHWHADTWVYWRSQNVPPRDPRWMEAWLSTHSPSDLFPNARNPREQREYRLAQLKDAYYDSARQLAWRKLFARTWGVPQGTSLSQCIEATPQRFRDNFMR